jgi:hypothetical protein
MVFYCHIEPFIIVILFVLFILFLISYVLTLCNCNSYNYDYEYDNNLEQKYNEWKDDYQQYNQYSTPEFVLRQKYMDSMDNDDD